MSKISMSAMPVSSTIKKPPQQVFPRIAGILPAAIFACTKCETNMMY
jgi:hypothetical protein